MGRTRYGHSQSPPLRRLPGSGLRAVFAEGYSGTDLRHDVLAGVVVGIVALPLSMALAIAVGVPPQHGLYTAIVAGIAVPLLGGSRFQVTGPTAAFIVILAPILVRQGFAGLLVAGGMAGVLLLAMGLFRLGRLIQFTPHPVPPGFTAGIGTVIGVLQIKDLLGLAPARRPDHFLERVWSYVQARHTARSSELLIGLLTLAVLALLPRWTKRVPAPLVALPLAAFLAWALHLEVATIGSRFVTVISGVEVHGIPRLPPLPVLQSLADGDRDPRCGRPAGGAAARAADFVPPDGGAGRAAGDGGVEHVGGAALRPYPARCAEERRGGAAHLLCADGGVRHGGGSHRGDDPGRVPLHEAHGRGGLGRAGR